MSNANRGLEGEKGLVRGTSDREKGRLVEAFGKKADRGLNLAMVNTNRGLKGQRS
jgi:hypothetical protein